LIVPLSPDGNQLGPSFNFRKCQRFATIDTAGTSKQKAAEDRGRSASWSVCAVWDYWPKMRAIFLRHVWRARVEWNQLKAGIAKTASDWSVPLLVIENAHFGAVLASELSTVCNTQMVNPMVAGMKDARVGDVKSAKLERAIASGLLTKLEAAEVYLPDTGTVPGTAAWMPDCETELLSWTGRPDETADQIDVFSYAANHVKLAAEVWGGVINVG